MTSKFKIIVSFLIFINSFICFNSYAQNNKQDYIKGQYLLSSLKIDLTKLNLSQQQKSKIIANRETNHKSMLLLKKDLKNAKLNLKNELIDDMSNTTKIKDALEQTILIKDKMERLILNDYLYLLEILNNNQKKLLYSQLKQIK